MEYLREQREALAFELRYNTNPDAFPGSKAFFKRQEAKKALAEFDAAHPEVKAESQAAAKKADDDRKAAYKDDPNSHYNRALRGED